MKFPIARQYDKMDCGPTCLLMIARYYGKNYSLATLRDKSQIGKEGVNLLGISEAAEKIGLRTQAVTLDIQTLTKEALLPAILYWDQNHFVVLFKTTNGKYFVADPGKGKVVYKFQEFKSHWINDNREGEKGIALLLEPTPLFYETNDDAEDRKVNELAFKNIFNYLFPYKKLVFQLMMGLVAASLLQLILPFLTQSVVDVGVNTANLHFVYIVLLAQMALFTGRMIIDLVRSWILLHISTRINISILTDFLIKLMKLPAWFFDSKKTGDILQRMNDHQRIESFLTGSSINVLFSLINLVVFSFVLAVFNLGIFITFILSSILYSIWVILFLKKRKNLDYKRFDVASKDQSTTIQLVQGMQEIKLNGVEKVMRWNWERIQARLFKLKMKELSLNQWQQSGAFFLNEGKNIFITFLSAKAVIDGHMTLGTMLAVQYIIGQLNSPIDQMIGFLQSWQNAKISLDRLNEIHSLEDEEPVHKTFIQHLPLSFQKKLSGGHSTNEFIEDPILLENYPAFKDLQKINSNQISSTIEPKSSFIHFNNVTFSYPGAGNEAVLNGINLKIEKGKTTAIVGVSGSGKTTLLKLLLKFYDPIKGEIKLDNTRLSEISHKTWRRNCGVVMQESFIFSDTIANNIAVGVEHVDTDKLMHAVNVANILEFIESLPLGFNTKIGAEGMGISMGQKQRILIARSVYRDPDFLFFDEATNSLDANNENIIMQNFQSFFKQRTVVVVAHRLSTVKNADQIIVLDHGEIAECGSHQELIALKGKYHTLVKNQLELGE